jgi:hypothetical protein
MEYEPILPAGFHAMTIDQIEEICVVAFPGSPTRRLIFERFVAFLDLLFQVGIVIEVWVDGSFLTRKPDPRDVDVVIFANPDAVNLLSPDKQKALMYLFSDHDVTKI